MITRLALAAGLLVLGSGTGLASVAVHDKSWGWFALATITPLATTAAVPRGWLRCGFGAGWLLVLALAIGGRSEGDAALEATARGYGLYVVGLVLMVAAVATIPRPVRPSP